VPEPDKTLLRKQRQLLFTTHCSASLLRAAVQLGSKAGHRQRSRRSFKSCSRSRRLRTRPAGTAGTLPRQKSFSQPQNNAESQLQKCRLGTNTLHSPNWQNLHLIYNIVKVTGRKLNRKCERPITYYTSVQTSVQSPWMLYCPLRYRPATASKL